MALTRLQKKKKTLSDGEQVTQTNQMKTKVTKRKEAVKVRSGFAGKNEYTTHDAARMVVYNGLTAAEALRATKHPCCRQTLYRHVRKLKQLVLNEVVGNVVDVMFDKNKNAVMPNITSENIGVPSCVTTTLTESVSSPLTMPDCFDDDEDDDDY